MKRTFRRMFLEPRCMTTRLVSLSKYHMVNTITIRIGGFILTMTRKKNADLILWKIFSHPGSFLFRFRKASRQALLFRPMIRGAGMLSNYWPKKVYAGNC